MPNGMMPPPPQQPPSNYVPGSTYVPPSQIQPPAYDTVDANAMQSAGGAAVANPTLLGQAGYQRWEDGSYSPPPRLRNEMAMQGMGMHPWRNPYQSTGGSSNYMPGVSTPLPRPGYQAGVSTPWMYRPRPVGDFPFGQKRILISDYPPDGFGGGGWPPQISDPNPAWNQFWNNFQYRNPIPTAYSNSVMPGIGGYDSRYEGYRTTYLGADGRRYVEPWALEDPWARVDSNVYTNNIWGVGDVVN